MHVIIVVCTYVESLDPSSLTSCINSMIAAYLLIMACKEVIHQMLNVLLPASTCGKQAFCSSRSVSGAPRTFL